jgi:hypothetical protein
MSEITIVCDAEKMKDPDLDIRYELPEYLASMIEGLEDDGYDYGEESTILELYMISKDKVDLNQIVETARKHARWGGDVGHAIQISVE